MVQETLQINIKADNKSGIVGVQQTIQSLDKLDLSAKKAGAAVANSGAAIKKSSGSYVELSRVIQDLPFGFTAISNNLTQLIPGVGALGLAFSGLVAALTFSQVGFRAWGVSAKAAKEEADKLNQSIAKEITDFRLLYTVATNANVPLEARRKAVKDLRDQYGGYLQDLTDEEILAGKATKAYEALSGAIIKAARARAAQDKIQKLQLQRLEKEAELADIKAQAEKASEATAIKAGGTNAGGFQKFTDAATVQADRLAFLRGQAQQLVDVISDLDKQMKGLEETVVKNTVKPFEQFTGKTGDAIDKTSKFSEILKQLNEQLKVFNPSRIGEIEQSNIDRSRQGQSELGQAGETGFQRLVQFQRELMATDEALRIYNEYASEAGQITGVFATSFTDLSNALLQGQSVGEAIGNVFRKLAADIAAAAIKALLFKSILGALTGGTSTALGALAGKGTSFGSLFGGFLGLGAKPFADGGVVNKPTLGVFGEAGSEAIMPLNKLNSMLMTASQLGGGGMANMEIMTKVSGQDLLLWIQRAGYSRNLQR